ncbi:MAG: PD40 domain-containing protein [Chloroflexi bacterium]|nr:PD40 domain-containing protein [Chloroflexota bacterium]
MRKSFRLAWVVLFVLLAAAPLIPAGITQAQDTISVTLSPVEVGVAETAVVEARIVCPAGSCAEAAITLNYDRAVMRVLTITAGPFWGAQPLESEKTIDNAQGIVTYAVSGSGGSGDLLFSLEVGGLIPGAATIDIAALEIKDPNGMLLVSTGTGASLNVFETGKIAFFSPPALGWEVTFVSVRDGNPEIYVASADGSSLRRLTDDPALDGSPTWTPDGGQLAFHSARDGNLEVYVMAPDGSAAQRLTDNPASDSDPAWSPDGKKLLFVSDRDGNSEIYVMNADGSDPQRLTDDPAVDTYPAWSPDGTEIAFTSSRGGTAELYMMNADGSNVRKLTNLFGSNGWYASWAPDSAQLALSVERDGSSDLYRLDRQAQNVTLLTKKGDWLASSDWSPDGGWIGYMGAPGGNQDLLVMDNQGQYLFRITDNPADDYDPDWRMVAQPEPVVSESPAVSAEPCVLMPANASVSVRLGPGIDRSIFDYMPKISVKALGIYIDQTNLVWFKLDKLAFSADESIHSLWVAKDQVELTGGCDSLPIVDPSPVVFGEEPAAQPQVQTSQSGWGACGSCATCDHPQSECVTSPEGQCLWDPATCAPVVEGGNPDDGCVYVRTSAVHDEGGTRFPISVSISRTPSNCGSGGYTPGTTVELTAPSGSSTGGFFGWEGSCGSGTNTTLSFSAGKSCSATAVYSVQ